LTVYVKNVVLCSSYKNTIYILEYAGHATEVIKTLKLDEWTGVVIVSGDGLIYEVSE